MRRGLERPREHTWPIWRWRVAGEALSDFHQAEHPTHGVDLHTVAAMDRIVGDSAKVSGVSMEDGSVLSTGFVIDGIGVKPWVGHLISANLRTKMAPSNSFVFRCPT